MSKLKQATLFLGAAVFALSAGFLLRVQFMDSPQPALSSEASKQGAEAILAANLPDINGEMQAISQWLGNVLVVNFWATWCEPCREEIPEFIETQDKFRDQGLVFLGVALDREEPVISYSHEFGINYPVLIGDLSVWSIAETAGNVHSVLPYTVVIDRQGEIVETYLGRVHQNILEKLVVGLLQDKLPPEQTGM